MVFSGGATLEHALTASRFRVRTSIARNIPHPERFAGGQLIADLEKPINPGHLQHAPPDTLERLADALALRYDELRRHLPISTQIYAWVAGRAWQPDAARDDWLEVASLIHMARLGAFEHVDGFAVRCYAAVTPDKPGWPKHQEAIEHAVVSTRAIAEAAHAVDSNHRRVLTQLSFLAHTRTGEHPLHPNDLYELDHSARRAGADDIGYWSAGPTVNGQSTSSIMRHVAQRIQGENAMTHDPANMAGQADSNPTNQPTDPQNASG